MQIIIKYRVILGNIWVRDWVGFITNLSNEKIAWCLNRKESVDLAKGSLLYNDPFFKIEEFRFRAFELVYIIIQFTIWFTFQLIYSIN